MLITELCHQLLTKMSGVSEELVMDVAGNPTTKWVAKEATEKYPGIVEVTLKEYEKGKRYLAAMGYDSGKEEEVDYFVPIPPVVAANDPRAVLEEICERYGLLFDLPTGPTPLVVAQTVETKDWMHIAGALAQRSLSVGYIVGHYLSKERYCIDLAFTLDIGGLLKAFEHS